MLKKMLERASIAGGANLLGSRFRGVPCLQKTLVPAQPSKKPAAPGTRVPDMIYATSVSKEALGLLRPFQVSNRVLQKSLPWRP